MSSFDPERVRQRFISVMGSLTFNRVVDSVPATEETPYAWMAAAWEIDSVRENLSYGLAREASKNGSLKSI
jgi:hypothetical protein